MLKTQIEKKFFKNQNQWNLRAKKQWNGKRQVEISNRLPYESEIGKSIGNVVSALLSYS